LVYSPKSLTSIARSKNTTLVKFVVFLNVGTAATAALLYTMDPVANEVSLLCYLLTTFLLPSYYLLTTCPRSQATRLNTRTQSALHSSTFSSYVDSCRAPPSSRGTRQRMSVTLIGTGSPKASSPSRSSMRLAHYVSIISTMRETASRIHTGSRLHPTRRIMICTTMSSCRCILPSATRFTIRPAYGEFSCGSDPQLPQMAVHLWHRGGFHKLFILHGKQVHGRR
jgi:hypothetical protein